MSKSPDAFRTISEVADWLGIQAHVLRFWESKFTQVKPIKRAGGRRYYRPADMLLLGGIKKLLHDDGLTIKGVQKLLREEGMSHVAGMSTPLEDGDTDIGLTASATPTPKLMAEPEEQSVVLPFEAPKDAVKTEAVIEEQTVKTPELEMAIEAEKPSEEPDEPAADVQVDEAEMVAKTDPAQEKTDEPTQQQPETLIVEPEVDSIPEGLNTSDGTPKEEGLTPLDLGKSDVATDEPSETQTETDVPADMPEQVKATEVADVALDEPATTVEATTPAEPEALTPAIQAEQPVSETVVGSEAKTAAEAVEEQAEPTVEATDKAVTTEPTAEEPSKALPTFLRSSAPHEETLKEPEQTPIGNAEPDVSAEPSMGEAVSKDQVQPGETTPDLAAETGAEPEVTAEPDATPPAPKARDIGMPTITPEHEIRADRAVLTGAFRTRALDIKTAKEAQPLLEQLAALRDRMAARRGSVHPKS
jgi:DNA-binding transcriptional MerR regulator